MLNQLAKRGLYGRTAEEVAARFVDAALQERFEPPAPKRKPRKP